MAALFSMSLAGKITQMPLLMGRQFGTKSMATLLNYLGFFINAGGALGIWAAGRIFDTTQSYRLAFGAGITITLVSLIIVLLLKRQDHRNLAPQFNSSP